MRLAVSLVLFVLATVVGCASAPTPTPVDAVQVVGQVAHPSALPYHEGMGVLDAILAVGGLTQAEGNFRARIVRRENGKETVIHVKLPELLNGGDGNVLLKPGDVLVVGGPSK